MITTQRDWKKKIEIDGNGAAEEGRETKLISQNSHKHTHAQCIHTLTKCELGGLINFQMFSGSNKFAAQGRHITWCSANPTYTQMLHYQKKFESKKVASIINPLTQSHSLSVTHRIYLFSLFSMFITFSLSHIHSLFRSISQS